MGSSFPHPHGHVWQLLKLAMLLVLTFGNTAVHAAGESILLPGYVQPSNAPPAFGNLMPTPILPGWTTPAPGFVPQPNPSGLKLIVDNSWPDMPGYRMVRLEFLANQPLIEERRMRVQLKFRNYNYGRAEMAVTTEEIVIPANQTGVKYQLYFPSEGQLRLHDVRTTENGETWPDLSCSTYSGQPNVNSLAYLDLLGLQTQASMKTTSLYINGSTGISSAPLTSTQSVTQDYRNGMTYAYPVNQGWTGFQKLSDLPNNPLGYDCFKVVLCRAEQLETLRADHPVQWDALRSWVATGGTLLIWPEKQKDAAATRESQQKLDELFLHGAATAKEAPRASWQKQTINVVPEPLQNNNQTNYYDDDFVRATKQASPSNNNRPLNSPGIDFPERAWFQGTLAVLPDEQYFDTVYAHLQNATSQPIPATPLPKVGLPPITMFQILITLFVILIGPVNYFYFKKKKRLNWLLITVPVGALAITGLLLAYTLFKDGIGVRTWSQSYTVLDQIQKQASTRQQFCLFAGITPGDGLRYRNQVNFQDIVPDIPANFSYRHRDTRNWDYSWDEPLDGSSGFAEQHLRIGWLPARTLKLYETREFALSQREMKITVAGDTCQLENKLGANVLSIYIIEGERGWNYGELHENARGDAKLLDETQLSNLRTTIDQDTLLPPSAFDASDRLALPPRDNTIAENFVGPRQLNRRVYIATVERWPELQSGVTNPAVESWGPHIILGVW
jgi:hypothetical protein